MQAILYVGHGTRVKKGNEQLATFINLAKKKIDVPIQEHCFIELCEPSISEGVDLCVQQGATNIAVVPVLLLTAGHAKVDIPEEIIQAKKKYPNVAFSYSSPFGVQLPIIEILGERLVQKGFTYQPDFSEEDRQDVTVLLVGRGSSDLDANSDLAKIARIVWEKFPVRSVETCYLAATRPTFVEGVEKVMKMDTKQVYVLPYLLFTGLLMKSMEKTIGSVAARGKKVELCDYLGYDPKLVDVLARKAREAMCPVCSACDKVNTPPCQMMPALFEGFSCPAIR